MVTIDIKGLDDVQRRLSALTGQEIPRVTALALSMAAEVTRKRLKEEMARVFDRPTPYTMNALETVHARPDKLQSAVLLKYPSPTQPRESHFLWPQILGGNRRAKPFESYLRRYGQMPSTQFAVPGAAARLNQYGNMSPGSIVQILSGLQALPETGYLANRTRRSTQRHIAAGTHKEYFAGSPGGGRLPFGVWQRAARGVKPMLVFVDSPRYQKRFDFFGVGEKTAREELPRLVESAIKRLLPTT